MKSAYAIQTLSPAEQMAVRLVLDTQELTEQKLHPSVGQIFSVFCDRCSAIDNDRKLQGLPPRSEGTLNYLFSVLESNGICKRTLFRTVSVAEIKECLDTLPTPKQHSSYNIFSWSSPEPSTKDDLYGFANRSNPDAHYCVEWLKRCTSNIQEKLRQKDPFTEQMFSEIEKRAKVAGADGIAVSSETTNPHSKK